MSAQIRSGDFATSRRGGLTREERHEIEAHRAKERPTPWQALAKRYGRPEIELRAMFEPTTAANDDAPSASVAQIPMDRSAVFTRLYMSGVPSRAIAERLGLTPDNIRSLRLRLGLPLRRADLATRQWSAEQDAFLRENYIAMSNERLGLALGCSRGTVAGRLSRLGLVRNMAFSRKRKPRVAQTEGAAQ